MLPPVQLPRCRLYIDDLARVESLVRHAATEGGGHVAIQTPTYTLESVADLAEVDVPPGLSIELGSTKPPITVRLGPQEAVITTGPVTSASDVAGAMLLIQTEIGRHQRLLMRFSPLVVLSMALAFAGGVLILILGSNGKTAEPPLQITVGVALFVLAMAIAIVYQVDFNRGFAVIVAATRQARPSFLHRNRDTIIVGIGFLILGAVITEALNLVK